MKYNALLLAILLSACSDIPPEAYYLRGSPESLLDVSSEVVNLSVGSDASLDELADWIQLDQPSRAELYCNEASDQCSAAQEVLDLYGVPTMFVPSADGVVSLVYERVLARDCENRYIENNNNPYHLNHPTFGCSIAVNMVQMVSDKHQFVRPNLMDPVRSYKAVQAYQRYLEAPQPNENGVSQSLLNTAKTE